MKIKLVKLVVCSLAAFFVFVGVVEAQSTSIVDEKFDLAGEHSQETQYFIMETEITTFALDGTRAGTDIFRLSLKCVPAKAAGKEGDEYTCVRFTLQQGNAAEAAVPALDNWSYVFAYGEMSGNDEVLGIDHGRFEDLKDGRGKPLPPGAAYHVYNTFIDFHTFCSVFAERSPLGKGIQDLTEIGQRVVHSSAFSEPPVNLGSHVAEGSFFKNGEVTIEFKGLGTVNGRQCALVGFDSGESSFKMIMNPMPNMEIQTVGRSRYTGDIYKNLETNWVQKVTMIEVVVSETTLPRPPNKINSIAERNIIIRNVTVKEFGAN